MISFVVLASARSRAGVELNSMSWDVFVGSNISPETLKTFMAKPRGCGMRSCARSATSESSIASARDHTSKPGSPGSLL